MIKNSTTLNINKYYDNKSLDIINAYKWKNVVTNTKIDIIEKTPREINEKIKDYLKKKYSYYYIIKFQ